MFREQSAAIAKDGVGAAKTSAQPSPRFAIGTRELNRLPLHQLLIEEMPDASFVLDPRGSIEHVNEAGVKLVEQPLAELVGKSASFVFSCNVLLGQDYTRYLSGANGTCVRARDGREIPVDVTVCPHGRGGSLAIVRPSVIETPREGLRNEDVAQIVHDLKNPLSTIALEGCLLEERVAIGERASVRAAVGRITQNVAFIDHIVQDLLDLCRLGSGDLVLRRVPTEMRTLLEHTIERVVPTRDRERVFLEAAEPVMMTVDDWRLERVFANLLENALKYAPRASGVVVRLDISARACCVSVIDAGPGLQPGEAELVFDLYRRAASSRGKSGSGIGLYVSKRIIEAHGGRIGVESVRGAGSRFFFELPLDEHA